MQRERVASLRGACTVASEPPAARPVDDADDLDTVASDAVGNDEGRAEDHELPRSLETAGPSHLRVDQEAFGSPSYAIDRSLRGRRIDRFEEGAGVVQVFEREAGPDEPHLRGFAKAAATSSALANSPALAWRTPSLMCSNCQR